MIWDVGDANPLHRRIPGEVVSRRTRLVKKPVPEKEPDEVIVDLKAAVALKPEQRLKWLTKACNMVTEGIASSTDLYDIIVNRKFVAGMPERVVRKISALIQESLELFSDKQQRYLISTDCPIIARLTVREPVDVPLDVGLEDAMRNSLAAAADDQLDLIQQKLGSSEAYPTPKSNWPPRSSALPVAGQRQQLQQELRESMRESMRESLRESFREQAAGVGSSSDSKWQAVKDEWAIRRQEAENKEQSKRDAAKRAEKKRSLLAEEEAVARSAEMAEAERRRKLEEEADALFSQAVEAPTPMLTATASKQKRERSLSRSRSISSRTARRLARANKTEKAQKKSHWRQDAGRSAELSGSRAIFMNRDFIDDLPHMPRPATPGVQGIGGLSSRRPSPEKSRRVSDSRTRSRRRR